MNHPRMPRAAPHGSILTVHNSTGDYARSRKGGESVCTSGVENAQPEVGS